MKNVFIDFEASQYTQEIISVGAVTDDGQEFYSLVKTDHKIGNFISNLTGIQQIDVDIAASPDNVFEELFYWLQRVFPKGDKIQFVCYGNSDIGFAVNTLRNLRKSMAAQAVLSMIICGMIDYSEYVKAFFGLSKHVSLLKVAQYYSEDHVTQDHNALNDARLLKFIYNKIQEGAPLVDNPFEEYMEKIEAYDIEGNLVETFYGMAAATKWVSEISHMPKGSHKKRIKNKIMAASQQKQTYCGFNWVVTE